MKNTLDALTITEAAQRLGVSERHVRRLLARPEYADRTRTLTRTTRTGTRTSAGVPPDLLEALQAAVLTFHESAEPANQDNAEDGPNVDTEIGQRGPEGQQDTDNADITPPFVFALLAEKDRRIEDLVTALDREREALEHEREAHRRAETLHLGTMAEMQRLQQRAAELESQNAKLIEALPVIVETPAAPAAPVGDTEGSDSGRGGVNNTDAPVDPPTIDPDPLLDPEDLAQPSRRSFWGWILGR